MSDRFEVIDRSYVLTTPLGEGGMGTVFRATQLVNKQEVALKLVTAQQSDATDATSPSQVDSRIELRLALAREFQTLASLHHPNVIRVLSYGFDERLGSYYTMELLAQPQTILSAGRNLSTSGKIRLTAQLLRALSYIHRRGVLHRDIKPANVLVVGDELKLLDFGISTGTESSTEIAGTIEYMAPDLLLGIPPTTSSDLYSVGLIVHQLLTDRLPIRKGQVDFNPLPPAELGGPGESLDLGDLSTAKDVLAEDFSFTASLSALDALDSEAAENPLQIEVPGELGTILQRMLHPLAEERYQSADEVVRALAAALGEDIPTETSQTRESFLRATVLVGRDSELATLKQSLEHLKLRHGGGLLLGGESGVGKSRLISELRTLALVYRFWVADGQSTADSGAAYQEWQPLLRALCFRTDIVDSQAAILKALVPDIAELLQRPIPDPPALSPAELPKRLAATLRALLVSLTRPVVILLEDLQWARPESLSLLSELSQNAAELPVLFVGNYRSDESPALPQELPHLQHLLLGRLGVEAVARLSQSMLGEIGSQPELVDYLTRQTEGNVFFLVEVVRALAEDAGELQRIGQGELPENILTAGIERIVERRIEHVDREFRPALEFAATMGRQLDVAVISHAFPALNVQSLLVHSANAAVLESQGSEWRFAHDKLRESILRRLGEAAARAVNLRIGEALEATYSGERRDRISAQLALHFRRAGESERAIPYDALAGDRAFGLGLLSESRVHYRNALEGLARLPGSLEVQRQQADLMLRLMQSSLIAEGIDGLLLQAQGVRTLLDQIRATAAVERADRLRQARLDYLLGQAYYYGGKIREAIEFYQRVLPAARELEDAELIAMPSAVIGQALVLQDKFELAYEFLGRGRKLLTEQGNELESMRCQIYSGLCLVAMGQYQAGMAEFRHVHHYAKERQNPRLLAMVGFVRSWALYCGMDWQGMLESTGQLGMQMLRAGVKTYAALVFMTEASAHAHLGNHKEAQLINDQYDAISSEYGGRLLGSDWQLASRAEVALLAGHYEEATRIARQTIERSGPLGLNRGHGIAERVLAVALNHLGSSPSEVETHLQASVEQFSSRKLVLDRAHTEIAWGDICAQRGDHVSALAHFRAAETTFRNAGCDHPLLLIQQRVEQLS